MTTYVCDQEMLDRIKDLRRGLHTAMTALITNSDAKEAELILRQMDQHITTTINNIRLVERR